MTKPISTLRTALLLSLAMAIVACSGGSGKSVEKNAPPLGQGGTGGVAYNGPSPTTDDVQNFKVNVWDNLAGSDRCGACHIAGEQRPSFVRADDINLAYAEVNPFVDLTAPSLSRLVTKVAEGHNCWRPEPSVCADIITNYIEAWAGASGSDTNQVVLTPPPAQTVGASRNFPSAPDGFQSTVYPLLTQYCADCHSDTSGVQQQPFFASTDVDIAYQAAKSKINLGNPGNSRLVLRLRTEFHNCWNNCGANSTEMEQAITAFVNGIPITEVDPALVVSNALGLPNGIIASSGGRFESNVIALYEFKTGSGSVAFDTSGVDPALDLNLIGNVEWVGSWGIRVVDGRAQGATSASRKLHDLIKSTGEYAIEAWVVPDNVAQDGPARIVTYSGGDDVRNFTLGQTTYDYNFLARHGEADANGMPMLSTPSADEVLQATLQHVVVNFDPIDGRTIYVNGELVAESKDQVGNLNDWDSTFALAVGQEVDKQYLWMGTLRLLAIHNRALNQEQVTKNFEAGVGEKFFLLFGVSHLIDMPQAYVVFQVQQFDDYAYLFDRPFFISLDKDATPPAGLTLEGLRIGVNGREIATGQAFAKLNMTIDANNYTASEGTRLSDLGALMPLDQGPDDDVFFISFDRIGNSSYARPADPVPPAPAAEPAGEQSDIGVRTFDEISQTLSQLSGVPVSDPSVAATADIVRRQLPNVENAQGFLSSHQSGVMQLSVAYCTALVNDSNRRGSYFPGFNFGQAAGTAFAGNGKELIIQPLMKALLAHELSVGGTPTALDSSAEPTAIEVELSSLIDAMSASGTTTAVISTCASAFGSALMLVQ